MKINSDQLIGLVADACADNPHLLPDIIAAATVGVKSFAEGQSDRAGTRGAMLFMLLEKNDPKTLKFAYFTRCEVMKQLEINFSGTVAWTNLCKMYDYPIIKPAPPP